MSTNADRDAAGADAETLLRPRSASRRRKMDREHRAKQFAPFAALKGFEECVQRQEEIYVDRVELSEERKEEIARTLNRLNPGDSIRVLRFVENHNRTDRSKARGESGQYHAVEGILKKIEPGRGIRIGEEEIPFEDIRMVSSGRT